MSTSPVDPLATLGRIWRQRENRLRQRVVAAGGQAASLQARLARLHQAMAADNEAIRVMLDEPRTATNTTAYRRRVSEIRAELAVQGHGLTAAREVLASRRVELAGAIKQRRALERLARKRAAARADGHRRGEQKELDDLHAARIGKVARASCPWAERQENEPRPVLTGETPVPRPVLTGETPEPRHNAIGLS